MAKILLLLIVASLSVAISAESCLPNCKTCNTQDPTICIQCKLDYFLSDDKQSCVKLEYTSEQNWSSLCSTGKRQSPINILTKDVQLCAPKKQFYNFFQPYPSRINPAGQGLKADYIQQSSIEYLMGNGKLRSYKSAQFHWHSPAEHQIDSKVYDLQLHVVHTIVEAGVTKYGVAGFFFQVDPDVHTDIFDRYDFTTGDSRLFAFPINPRNRMVYHYQGSLTTPPCIEKVDFFLYMDYIPITQKNFKKMKESINSGQSNARKVQDLNGRTVQLMGGFCNLCNHE